MTNFPKIENCPGIAWRPRKQGWEARWRARQDLIERGFRPKHVRLWISTAAEREPNEDARNWIADQCNQLQTEMLVWGRGGIPMLLDFDGTVRGLTECFRRDPDSAYHKKRYATRKHYDVLCKRLDADIGHFPIEGLTARELLRWHRTFTEKLHVSMGHACIGMLRTIATFGATILDDKRCRELKVMLHDMRFEDGKARVERLTADQVSLIRIEARDRGHLSIALAQALQFELTLRQKDVIGEWVPISEPGLSPVATGNSKWLRGLDWREVDENWILRHVTSKKQKEIVVNLRNAPMVIDELGNLDRSAFPASGPMVLREKDGLPWVANAFRRYWRQCADAVGVPKAVRNMDSRAGAITEALEAGALPENVRKTATHSDLHMTAKYSRGDEEAIADVMTKRAANRTKREVK
jgi:hypothetical protein